MYIRKKNNENSRIKRPAKRSKSCDMFFTTGYGFYLKPIAIFSVLLTIDFLMEIRVEYLWSCWLLMKSITDSYKYQGLIFSLFFMLIVLTSDIICYLLIPITWIFFLASTYVWIQLVGHTERGICLPTVIICLLFFYIEYILRLRGFSHISLSMEICRPFAANGIGYPVVTMGFGLKSYVAYKFRMRKQKTVEEENRFFFQLIDQALPEDNKRYRLATAGENDRSSLCDESVENSSVETPPVTSSTAACITNHKPLKQTLSNGKVDNSHSSDLVISKFPTSTIDYVNQWALSTDSKSPLMNGHIKQQKTVTNGCCISEVSSCTVQNIKKASSSCCQNNMKGKDDIFKCDIELKRLRTDLQIGRTAEVDLRAQLTQASQVYNSLKVDLNQCRQELLMIQNKFQTLQQKYQNEKQSNLLIDKKLTDEKKNCQLLEQQLAAEKKARKEESEIKSKALQSATLAAAKSSECTESCKTKRRQLDLELKSLKKEKQSRDDQIRNFEQQLSDLPKLRKMVEEYQHMSINITNLREEKEHLVRTLSDENKIKQNLITAYHSSLKEVNALNEQLTQKDYQILQLNMNGVADYMTNHQSHFHHMQRHTPMTPSSSPLMDESNLYVNNSNSLMSPSMYTTMMNSCVSKSPINNVQSPSQQHHQQQQQHQHHHQQQQQQQQSNDYNNIISQHQQSMTSSSSSSSLANIVFSSGCQSSSSPSSGLIASGYNVNSIAGINSQSRISDKVTDNHQSTNLNQW